ncbi:unnamed protein product [Sympodiomycopsis kandeliae]
MKSEDGLKNSQDSGHTEPCKADFSYRGVLKDSEIQQLQDQFGEMIICPGYTGKFGGQADKMGLLSIPGALSNFWEATRKFKGWRTKGKTDTRFSWWESEVSEKGLPFVKAKDILDGLPIDVWRAKHAVYKKAMMARSHRRCKLKKRLEALKAQKDRERAADSVSVAATALLSLPNGR